MASFPTCVVCNTSFKYKGPKPHLLPCLHAVCSGCLGADVNSVITCSVCQRSHDRINQSFPVDHVVLAEVLSQTAQHRPSEISCTNKEDGNQAVCWCEECSDFLCEHCQISHAEIKASRVHKIWEMSDLSQTFKTSHSKCITHGLPENVFDKECGTFMCCQCFFIEHIKHDAIRSEETAAMAISVLKDHVKSVSETKGTVLYSKMTVDAHAKILEQTSLRLRQTVQHTFSGVRSLLDQREKVILLELDQLMECTSTTNNSRRPVLKGIETSCQATLDYMNKCLLYAPPQHLHQLKSSIGKATQFCNNSDVPKVHQQEVSIAFSKQGLQDLRTVISSFGSFLAPVGETGHPDEFTSSHIVTRTLERLQAQLKEVSTNLKTLTDEVSKRGDQIQELEKTNRHLEKVVQQIEPDGLVGDSFLHLIKSCDNQMFVVKSPKMTLDYERANLNCVQVDETGTQVDCLQIDKTSTPDDCVQIHEACVQTDENDALLNCVQTDETGALLNCVQTNETCALDDCVKIDETSALADCVQTEDACVQTNETGTLVDDKLESKVDNAGRLQKYNGTSATAPLPSSGLVYWEVEADIDIVREVHENDLLLEIAVCDEDVMDVSHYVGGEANSSSLCLAHSPKHGSIFLYVFENGKDTKIEKDVLPSLVGTVRHLKFGVLFDGKTQKVTFLDVIDMKILESGTVSMKSKPTTLWPMFAPFEYTKNMKLVSGVDIIMSSEKENVLCSALQS